MEKCLFLLPIKNVHPSEKIKASKSKKLDGITIAYGITGSIAAVESVKIARELIRHGADVVAIMSRDAMDIITPDALKFATGRDAIHKLTGNVEHLMDADLLLIAPCTANTLAKVVNGIADNPITTFALAAKKILIAPSMDEKMYANKTVKNNLKMAEKAMEIIKIGDRWPYRLEWDWIENRHIIRAILNKAIYLWAEEKNDEALELFRRLLKMNPPDQIGARFYILAIRKGISFEEFEERFNKEGKYDDSLFQWFDENFKEYMDEFKEWYDEMRALGI